jgi:hypothetical protein
MNHPRANTGNPAALWLLLFAAVAASKPAIAQAALPASAVLDKVVAVVNDHAILASDIDEEMRLAVPDPGRTGLGVLSPKVALDQLISRSLIEQQIREEDAQSAEPAPAEVAARIVEIRREIPACVRQNCAAEAGWRSFLSAHELTPERVESYVRYRLQILRFIEMRFRQGIRISPEEIKTYYDETLLPQYGPGDAIPSLDQVSPRIQEILLQRQVNLLFDDWLKKLREEGEVEVLDPDLQTSEAQTGNGAGR